MKRSSGNGRVVALALAVGLAATAAPASAQVIDKAQVGASGRNATQGTSPATYVYFPSPVDYTRASCCLDGDSGAWQGPEYKPGSASGLGWEADFDMKSTTAEAEARKHLIHGFPDLETAAVQVPHNVGGRQVGTIPAFSVLTQQKAGGFGAQTEGALTFTLGRNIWMAGRFSALEPRSSNDMVNGQSGATWNAEKMREAMRNVHVDGSLPPAKVSAAMKGRVSDVYGHPVAGATVVLQRRRGTSFRKVAKTHSDARGRFAFRAKAAGTLRVVATLAGSTAASRSFHR